MRPSLAAKVLTLHGTHARTDDSGGGGGGGGSAPTFVGSTFGYQGTSTADLSLAMPAGATEGDYIFMGISDFYDAVNYDPAGDWNFIGTSDSADYTRLSVYGRFLGASEADPVVIPAARFITCGHIGVVRGVAASPIGNVYQTPNSVSGNPGLLPAVTTTAANSMVVCVGSIRKAFSGATTVNADLTGLTDEGAISGASNEQTTNFLAQGIKATAGAVSDFSCTYSNAGSESFNVAFELLAA